MKLYEKILITLFGNKYLKWCEKCMMKQQLYESECRLDFCHYKKIFLKKE